MFPCTSCGLCCQNISTVEELNFFDLGNGVCKYFDITTKACAIYNSRPNICRIDKMFDVQYHKFFTKEEFYIENAKVCNSLQEKYGIDKSYRINIGEE